MHIRSQLRPLALTVATCLCLVAPATVSLGHGAATPTEQPDGTISGDTDSEESPCSDQDGGGYVFQLGENGYEAHWVDNPGEMGYYNHEGNVYWNPGQSC